MPEILTFININIEPLFFGATKQLQTQKIKSRAQDHRSWSVSGAHLSSAGALWVLPRRVWQSTKATIPGKHSKIEQIQLTDRCNEITTRWCVCDWDVHWHLLGKNCFTNVISNKESWNISELNSGLLKKIISERLNPLFIRVT